MPANPNFPHLPLIFRGTHRARLQGGGQADERTVANRNDRLAHAGKLRSRFTSIRDKWISEQNERQQRGLPTIGDKTVFVLELPKEHNLTYLTKTFGLELVAEYEDGFVLAGAPGLDLRKIEAALAKFELDAHGGASCAKILEVYGPDDPQRLNRVLSEKLRGAWPFTDAETRMLDIWVEIPGDPGFIRKQRVTQGPVETDEAFRVRKAALRNASREEQEVAWDKARDERVDQLEKFVVGNGGEIVGQIDDPAEEKDGVVFFPDSVLVRVKMSGRGFRDVVLNFPYLVLLCEPDEADKPAEGAATAVPVDDFELTPPPADAPAVCIVDSGIQEGHRWLRPAIDTAASHCYLPNRANNDVADEYPPVGHGTPVAGAVLYPGPVPRNGQQQAVAWLQNARVLNEKNEFSDGQNNLLDLQRIVERYRDGGRRTRLFVHSINDRRPCRQLRMTAWAALIDSLSHENDILVMQSAGNLKGGMGDHPNPGVAGHLAQKRAYPSYLLEDSSRIAAPAQSLQALTVGSVAPGGWADGPRCSFARAADRPSAFSRTGLGLWDSIKPDVVEYGGDFAHDGGGQVLPCPATAPELVQCTLHGQPVIGRYQVGTSFAAPKVAHIAAWLQNLFPDASTLLYRALIINSARWPKWAESVPSKDRIDVLRHLGYGIPDLFRATENTTKRVTLITEQATEIKNQQALIFCVPVPPAIRDPAQRGRVRIDVTLCYSSTPRPTRSTKNGYLETWLSWKASHLEEPLDSFIRRSTRTEDRPGNYPGLKWMLHERDDFGGIEGTSRHNGTAQKDWVVVENTALPEQFAIAVQAHKGWSQEDGGGLARFVLVVSFEALDSNIEIYTEVEVAVKAVIRAQAEVEVR